MTHPLRLLWLCSALFVVLGLGFVFFPGPLASLLTSGEPLTPAALTDLRASYGGTSFGIGLLLGYAALRPRYLVLGLLAALAAPLHQRLADQAHRDGALGTRLSLAVVLHPPLSPRCAPPSTLAQERGAAPSSQSRPWRSASRRISSMLISRMRNFWILPVTVIGNSSTNLKWRGILK